MHRQALRLKVQNKHYAKNKMQKMMNDSEIAEVTSQSKIFHKHELYEQKIQ